MERGFERASVGRGLEGNPEEPSTATINDAAIRLRRDNFEDNNVGVVACAGFHPGGLSPPAGPDSNNTPTACDDTPTLVAIDIGRTTNWSPDRKQREICHILGYIVGLDDSGPDRNDCMETSASDNAAHMEVGDKSIDLVDDFYGPNVAVPTGSLYANRSENGSLNPASSYSLTAPASGHALQSIEIYLDDQANPVAQDSSITCSGSSCSDDAIWNVAPGTIQDGEHRIRIVATNAFGQTEDREFDVVVCRKYASPTGTDSTAAGAGGFTSPYRTVSFLANHISSGQVGCFRGGNYRFDRVDLTTSDTVLRPYASEPVILRGEIVVQSSASGVVIEDMTLDDMPRHVVNA